MNTEKNNTAHDTRNVIDEFRGKAIDDIRDELNTRRHRLHIAVENLERDFNAGTIVRTANAFNVETVHVIGRRQWNKRGAMMTDKYMNLQYHPDIQGFLSCVSGYHVIGIDNIDGSRPMTEVSLPEATVLVFGNESYGLSADMVAACEMIVAIEQFGSTRSMNVGVASGIAMYCWLQQNVLQNSEKSQKSY